MLFSVRPEVEPTPSNGIIVTKTGQSVTLACQVTKGSPAPEVEWRRKEGRKMPDGAESTKGMSLTFTKVTRHNSGIYVCAADNGFGEPSTAEIKLDVEREYLVCPEMIVTTCIILFHHTFSY